MPISWWATDPYGASLLVEPCSYSRVACGSYCLKNKCRPEHMIYLSHMDCWRLASSSARISSLDWSRLAVQTRPFDIKATPSGQYYVFCHDDPGIPVLASLSPDSGLFHAGTPLANLLSKVRTLSTELQFQVMSLLQGTMFASLLQAKIFVLDTLPRLGPRSAWAIQPKPRPLRASKEQKSDRLACRSTHIMGRSYLSDLALGHLEGPSSYIHIADKEIRGLQFALGRFGLRGVCVLYEDETSSLWLGDSSFCWVGTVPCSNLSRLNVIADVSDPYVPAEAALLHLA